MINISLHLEHRPQYTPLKPVETETAGPVAVDSLPTNQQVKSSQTTVYFIIWLTIFIFLNQESVSMEKYTEMLASKEQEIEALKAENQVLKNRLENHPGIIVDGQSFIFIFLNFQLKF